MFKRISSVCLALAMLATAPACNKSSQNGTEDRVKQARPDTTSSESSPSQANGEKSLPGGPTASTEAAKPAGESNDRSLIVGGLANRLAQVASTARYFVATYIGKSPTPNVTGEGVADFKANQYLLNLQGQEAGGGTFSGQIVINADSMYAGEPGTDSKTWPRQAFTPDDVPMMVPDIELLAGKTPWPRPTNDSVARLKVFEAMVSKMDLAGEEQLHSTPVRHFKVELNRDQAKAKLPAELAALAGSGVENVEVWIDGQGRLRKLQTNMRYFELRDFDSIPAPQLPKTKLPS